jgi:predicted permease
MPDPSTNAGSDRAQARGQWSGDLRARLSGLNLGPEREAEIVDEVSQHLDDRYQELRAGGTSDADARRLALEDLDQGGGLAAWMRGLAQAHAPAPIPPDGHRGLVRGVSHDLRYAVRTIRRQPGFSAVVVATLAIGMAVNTLVFTIVNAAVLRPMPFEAPHELVRLAVDTGNPQNPYADLSYLDVLDWQQARRTFEHIAAADERGVDLSGDQHPPDRVEAAFVSWNLLAMLRVPPALGRGFTAADDRPSAPPTTIISSDLWRTRYAADPGVLGTTLRIDGVPSTIIGVMPPGFGFPNRAQVWVPVAARPELERESRGARTLEAVGRLRSGVTIEQGQSELAGIAAALAERYPDTNRNVTARVEAVSVAPALVAALLALVGAVGFVLLIACANVANLLLARAADRSREVALRLALGSSRWRIARQLLAESLLLAAAGGVAGIALSYAGLQLFVANLGPEAAPPSWIEFTFDRVVFAYVAALCLGSAVACGLVPALQASHRHLVTALNDAGRGETGSRHRRWTGAFVVAQVALALVLLTGATMMARNLATLLLVDGGVESDELLQTGFVLRRSDSTPERRLLFFEQLEERLASGRGVDAALTSNPPMAGAAVRTVRLDAQPTADANAPPVSLVQVGRRYFDVLGAPLVSGRVFNALDANQPGERAVVNERFARMYFGDQPAVGRRILLVDPDPAGDGRPEQWMTIVGVIDNVRQRMLPSREFDPVVYRPYRVAPPQSMQVIARSASGPGPVAGFVRNEVQALDPDLPLFPITTIEEAMAQQWWPQRVFGSLFGAFALVAMLLAACGLYAVTAYAIARRTREIGVRVALGADARSVWWTVTGATLRQLGIGLVLGTAGAAAIATVLPAMLVGTGGAEPLLLAAVAAALVVVGVVASAIPARRAMRLDAAAALQVE